jgi:hypothetical protein
MIFKDMALKTVHLSIATGRYTRQSGTYNDDLLSHPSISVKLLDRSDFCPCPFQVTWYTRRSGKTDKK